MTDIAKLGFSVNTADLKQAKADLNALVPASAKAERASLALAKAEYERARATVAAMRATGTATKEEIAAAAALVRKANAAVAATRADIASAAAMTNVDTAARGAVNSIGAVGNAATGASAKLSRLGSAANDNLNAVQATPANIAAQFQDIGVTAAAGMNPMLIALQQGTQLSVAFSSGFKGIGEALKQIFSPVALLTIGAVALVAALIQMVDWAAVGKSVLYALADSMEVAAPYAVALAAGLALINAPAIVTGVISLTKAMYGLAASMLAVVGIPALIVIGLVAIVAAANVFRDDLTKILGFDIVKVAKDGVNFIVGFFVGAYNGIVKSWGMIAPAIDDILAQAVQYSRNRVEQMINSAIDGINSLLDGLPDWLKIGSGQIARVKFEGVPNPNAGAAARVGGIMSGEMNAAQGVDYVGKSVNFIESGAKYLSGKLRGIADNIGKKDDKKKGGADKASTGQTDAEKFADIVKEADKRISALNAETMAVGVYGEALYEAKAKHDLLEMAQQKGLKLDAAQIALLGDKAREIAKITALNEKLAYFEDLRISSGERIEELKAEQATLGLFGADLRRVQLEYQMLADARRKNIDLAPDEIEMIRGIAAEQAELEETMRRQRESFEFNRESTRGFFKDFVQGARDGQGAWSAFSNAFNNFMDKLIDKLLNEVLDAVFQVNNAVGGQGGGGLLGSIGKVLGLVGGSGFGSVQSIMAGANASLGAGSFGMVAPGTFAKGDAFTNTVVSRPTAFAFGKGGANLGIMGEKDPEAVMPLQRGPDGSLGVQMYGDRRQAAAPPQEVTVKIVADDDRFNAYVDTRIGAQAPGIVQAGAAVSQREASFRQTRKLA